MRAVGLPLRVSKDGRCGLGPRAHPLRVAGIITSSLFSVLCDSLVWVPRPAAIIMSSSLFIQEMKRAKKEVETALADMSHGTMAGLPNEAMARAALTCPQLPTCLLADNIYCPWLVGSEEEALAT